MTVATISEVSRVELAARISAPLLVAPPTWIKRRKETVTILDDTALRRQISVDFALPAGTAPVESAENGEESLFCAPIFVLPKTPTNKMAFDLKDEAGRSLALMNRDETRVLSAQILGHMAADALDGKASLPGDLRARIEAIGAEEVPLALRIADEVLIAEPPAAWAPALAVLREHKRFTWWARTLAHSALVAVLFRAKGARRKLLKLSFEEPISARSRLATRFGWAGYEVLVDTSWAEAGSFHVEVEAPPGTRIVEARVADDEAAVPVKQVGFMRRVHLYRPAAYNAGAASTPLRLVVSGYGFVSGATVAAIFGLAALFAVHRSADEIAANPTSAPALLLLFPGLVASYVGRPDQHALTTRLLAAARYLLLWCGFMAYVAAAVVALGGGAVHDARARDERVQELQTSMEILIALSAAAFLGLAVSWLASRWWLRAGVRRSVTWLGALRTDAFEETHCVPLPPANAYAALSIRLRGDDEPHGLPEDGDSTLENVDWEWYGRWLVRFELEPHRSGAKIRVRAVLLPSWWNPVPGLAVRRKRERLARQIEELR